MIKFVGSVGLALALTFSCANAAITTEDQAQIEKIIDDYVSNHPEVILRAMKKFENDQNQRNQESINQLIDSYRSSNTLPMLGDKQSKHFIIEFYDYNCGYCKTMEPLFHKANKEDDTQIIYVNIPILGEASKQLSEYGQAIYLVDKDKYFQFHDYLMSRPTRNFDREAIKVLCKDLKIDFEAVEKMLKSELPQKQIRKSIEDSMNLNITGTPYLIIDGKEVRGAIRNYEQLKSMLN